MINKVILIGHLGEDPEKRSTQSGTAVVNFRLATTERWKDSQGKQQKNTEWVNVVAWRKLAEVCANLLQKGSLVYLQGKLQTRKWQDQSGNDRYTTEVVISDMQLLANGRNNNSGSGDYGDFPPEPPN